MYRPLNIKGAIDHVLGSLPMGTAFEHREPLDRVDLAASNVKGGFRMSSRRAPRSTSEASQGKWGTDCLAVGAPLLRDSMGVAACEIVWRTLGMGHVIGFETVAGGELEARCEARALRVAIAWPRAAASPATSSASSIDRPRYVLADACSA